MRATCLLLAVASAAGQSCVVEQIRLTLTQATDGSEMAVSWATPNMTTPAGYSGVVSYGTSPSSMTMKTLPGDSRFYTLNGVHSPFLHYTVMTGLVPRTTYYYSIGPATKDCPASPTLNFTSPPRSGAAQYPLRVVGYGASAALFAVESSLLPLTANYDD